MKSLSIKTNKIKIKFKYKYEIKFKYKYEIKFKYKYETFNVELLYCDSPKI
jgi:hypothetical protein